MIPITVFQEFSAWHDPTLLYQNISLKTSEICQPRISPEHFDIISARLTHRTWQYVIYFNIDYRIEISFLSFFFSFSTSVAETQILHKLFLSCKQKHCRLQHLWEDRHGRTWETCCVCICVCLRAQPLSHVQLFETVAHQAPLSMEISRQEYWSGLPCPPSGDFPDPGIEPTSPASPALAGKFFTTEPPPLTC